MTITSFKKPYYRDFNCYYRRQTGVKGFLQGMLLAISNKLKAAINGTKAGQKEEPKKE
jgi:hypothetical protein